MEQRRTHAEASGAGFFRCWAALVVFAGTQPATPPLGAEACVVVEAVPKLVVLTPAKHAVGWLRWLVEGVVDCLEGPVVIEVNGMRGIDCLESVVESDRRWPHLWEHVVLHEVSLAVHEVQ